MNHDAEWRAHGAAFLVLLIAVAVTAMAYYATMTPIEAHRRQGPHTGTANDDR